MDRPKLRIIEVVFAGMAVGAVGTALVVVPQFAPPPRAKGPSQSAAFEPAPTKVFQIGKRYSSVQNLIAKMVPNGAKLSGANFSKGHLVVFLGECTSCSLTSYGPTDIKAEAFASVHFLFDKASNVKVDAPNLAPNVRLFWLVKSEPVMQELKSDYTPRAFLFGEDGTLLDYQTSMPDIPSFVQFKESSR